MNKGEGARIAAKSKSGQVGIYLFKEPEKRKKKFNYKSRTQGFAVRKVATSGESEPTVPQSKLTQKETAIQKKKETLNKPKITNDATKVAKSQQNFVKKNIQKTKKQVSTANTVTLTQDQLNKILQTLGGENTSLKVENGDIKIEDASAEQNTEHENVAELGNEGIVNSTETSLNQELLPNETEAKIIDNEDVHKSQSKVEEVTEENQKSVSTTTPRCNLGDIGSSIGITGFNDKDDAQRRRQQWKAELDKQVAEKQQEKERIKKACLSGDGAADWSPWGNLGDSRGRGQKKIESLPPEATQTQNVINEKSSSQPFKPDPPPSRVDHSYRQVNTPAAMRSSFSFGNSTDESTTLKQKEKKAWLEELNKQRQEVKVRQAKEKLEASKTEEDYWAKQVPTVRNSVTSQNMVTKDDTAVQEKASVLERSETVQSDPMSGTTAAVTNTIITPRGHQRGQWSLTDPAEIERQEKARAKHLEHIEAVKAQVEEKQRLKKEAIERKKREDKEEEEKLARERENLQKQVEMENQRQKQKEQDALAKHQALVESMQRAYEESMKLKQEKRKRHLNTHTSDVADDIQHKENESIAATPRIGGSHGPVQRTPPPPPVETQVPKAVDVRQSTVFEQGVQTDPSFVHEEEILTRLIERDKSAGIEYKEHKEEKQKKSKENDNYNLVKDQIEIPKSRENKEIEVKVKKRKNKISERPKWGVKSEPKKKVKASDKDLTVSKKVREERRQKRMQELLADQERNMPRPRSKKEGGKTKNRAESPAFIVIPCPENEIDEVLKYSRQDQRSQRNQKGHRDQRSQQGQRGLQGQQDHRDHYDQRHQHDQRGHKEQKHHASQESRTDRYREDERLNQAQQQPSHLSHHLEDVADTPPLKTGDFVPFLRTDERLDVDSVPVTPIEYFGKNIWERNIEPEPNRKHTHHQQNHKDPLFSPDIRKDGEHRQRMILKQLSNLRQGLMIKQREVELGLSTTPLST